MSAETNAAGNEKVRESPEEIEDSRPIERRGRDSLGRSFAHLLRNHQKPLL
jgi:hypothetical protein